MLTLISQYSSLLPLILGIIFLKKVDSTLRKLSVLFFCTVIWEVFAVLLRDYTDIKNNLFLFHSHTLIETSVLSLVYIKIFHSKSKKNLAKVLFASFLIFSFINIFIWEPLTAFPSNQRYVEGIIIILFCLLYFHQLFQELNVQYLERFAYFWLSSALLIYFSGTLFLFISFDAISDLKNIDYFDVVHSSLNFLLNLGYAITIWVGRKSI